MWIDSTGYLTRGFNECVFITRINKIFSWKMSVTNFSPNAPFWFRRSYEAFWSDSNIQKWKAAQFLSRKHGEAFTKDRNIKRSVTTFVANVSQLDLLPAIWSNFTSHFHTCFTKRMKTFVRTGVLLQCLICQYLCEYYILYLVVFRQLYSMIALQILCGLARLQATYRARVLASKYITLRERMKVFQAFCRGFLARQEYKNRLRSIIKIQSGIRMVLAKRRTQELRVEVRTYRTWISL